MLFTTTPMPSGTRILALLTTRSRRGPAAWEDQARWPVLGEFGLGATRLIAAQPPGRTFAMSRNHTQVVVFTIAVRLMIAPAVAGTPTYLSVNPPKITIDSGPSLSLGRVGPDPCPEGLCRTESHSNLFNLITPKGIIRPNQPAPGILLKIPLGNGAHASR